MPIHLSDYQSLAVTNAAAALCPDDRDRFMAAVAHELAGQEIGDGAVHRAVALAFHTFWKPPEIPRVPPRWARRS